MTTEFSWALIGPGRIANRFAQAVQGLPHTRLACVLGRDPQRTKAFAAHWSGAGNGTVRATAVWDEVLNDASIDGIYIVTPHALQVRDLRVHGVLAPTGVDQRLAANLTFEGDVVSQLVCGFDGQSDNALHIMGEHGWINATHNFWQATEVVLQTRSEPPQHVQTPFVINGFEGEIVEAMRCIRAGLVESPHMPHTETLARLGVRYPFEA